MLGEFENQINKLFDMYFKNQINLEEFAVNVNRLVRAWDSSRIDIKNQGSSLNTINFLELGKNINVSFPNWFSDNTGKGCKLEWYEDDLTFIFSCVHEGDLKIFLRGVDFRDIGGNRVPIYVNFNKMIINESVHFERDVLIWHNDPYVFTKYCEDNEVLLVDLKFKTLFEYFSQLKTFVDEFNSKKDVNLLYEKITRFIIFEKSLLKL